MAPAMRANASASSPAEARCPAGSLSAMSNGSSVPNRHLVRPDHLDPITSISVRNRCGVNTTPPGAAVFAGD